jgi:hypothetical protein
MLLKACLGISVFSVMQQACCQQPGHKDARGHADGAGAERDLSGHGA